MVILAELFSILIVLLHVWLLISRLEILIFIIISWFILITLLITLILSLFIRILIVLRAILLILLVIHILLIKLIFAIIILFLIINPSIVPAAIFIVFVLVLIFKIMVIFITVFLLFVIFSISWLRLVWATWALPLNEIIILRLLLCIILIIIFLISLFYILCIHSLLRFFRRQIKSVAFFYCKAFVEWFFALIRNKMSVICFLMNSSKRSNRPFEFSSSIKLNNNSAFLPFVFIVYLLSTSREPQRLPVWTDSFWKCIFFILSFEVWISFIFFINFSLENVWRSEYKLWKHAISFFESLEPTVSPHCFFFHEFSARLNKGLLHMSLTNFNSKHNDFNRLTQLLAILPKHQRYSLFIPF